MNAYETRIQNILAMYGMATDQDRADGMRWYESAHALAASLAHRYGFTVRQMAGVIAVLSPNISWSRNVQLATLAAKDGKASGTFGKNTDKADRILNGADPADVVSGPKVTNFFQNIMTSGENDGVTVDRHAVSIAEAREVGDDERGKLVRVNKSRNGYGEYVDAYREAAYRAGISPAKLQAITWVAWREMLEGRVK